MSGFLKPLWITLALAGLAALLLSTLGQGLWHTLVSEVITHQRALHRGLADAMMALSRRKDVGDWLDLILLSLGYGVFHALGPGHGKAVVATYLLTHRAALKRGLIMTASAALLQGVVAIVIVTVLVLVLVLGFGWLTREAMASTAWVEKASFVAVAALGLWLMIRAGRGLRGLRGLTHRATLSPSAETVESGTLRLIPMSSSATSMLTPLNHVSSGPCHCGRTHHIDPMKSGRHWREITIAIFSIGLRPCSGAVMVLGVAAMLGFWSAGVMAVLAMSTGTALSTSLLAAITVLARRHMAHLFQHTSGRWPSGVGYLLALLGGALITLLGISLLMNAPDASLSPLMRGPL